MAGVDTKTNVTTSSCLGCVEKPIVSLQVASSTDVEVPSGWISGSAFMPDGRLVLADGENDQLLLLDKDLTVCSELSLSSTPNDVAAVDGNNVIVTLPNDRRPSLKYVTVGSGLQAGRTIYFSEVCFGGDVRKCWNVAVRNDEIYATFHAGRGGGEAVVLDESGTLKRRIGVDNMISTPNAIAVSPQGDVFMSDGNHGDVYCYGNARKPVYLVRRLGLPEGILADTDGNVLLCCPAGNEVVILRAGGIRDRVLLSWNDGINSPCSMTYRNSDDTLIVTMCEVESGSCVRAYKLRVEG